MSYLWGLVDGSHLSSDAQWDVCVLSVSAVQVSHPLTARLPPEVQKAVSNGVVLKHDVVHMSVFLEEERKTSKATREMHKHTILYYQSPALSVHVWSDQVRTLYGMYGIETTLKKLIKVNAGTYYYYYS